MKKMMSMLQSDVVFAIIDMGRIGKSRVGLRGGTTSVNSGTLFGCMIGERHKTEVCVDNTAQQKQNMVELTRNPLERESTNGNLLEKMNAFPTMPQIGPTVLQEGGRDKHLKLTQGKEKRSVCLPL